MAPAIASNLHRRARPALGTVVEIGVGACDAAGDDIVDLAFGAIAQAQARWSFHDPASELSRLNARPGQWVRVSRPTIRLLRLARALMRASDGAFDCTLGGWLVAAGALPDHGGEPALPRGDASDIEIGACAARLRRPVRLTLDGIAKGYAVDLAIQALQAGGAAAGWVNAGGDLRVFGDLALPLHRRNAEGRIEALGLLRDSAVATSASWPASRRDAQRHPARLIGRGGELRRCGCWSVLAGSAWRADALTKVAAATAGPQRARVLAALGGRLLGAAS